MTNGSGRTGQRRPSTASPMSTGLPAPAHRFTHDLMDIPGHDSTPMPTSALDSVVTWMREQQLV